MELVHATSLALMGKAVLLMGPSGSGKSDLALRLIDQGAVLISDDQTELRVQHGQLLAAPPKTIRGLIEMRGFGIVNVPYMADVPVVLAVELTLGPIERMPDPEHRNFTGVSVPLLQLHAFEASAAAKLRLAVQAVTRDKSFSND